MRLRPFLFCATLCPVLGTTASLHAQDPAAFAAQQTADLTAI